MNEGTKTGVFWVAAVAMLAVAIFVSWPTTTDESETNLVGQILFDTFSDPVAAASMRIVSFDEEQGKLNTFEVRKDSESQLWTIPSRDGYPADALEQMRDAANSLVGLKVLDTQTSNAEDHDDLGVAEPKLEDLQVGDEGVGRMVTFKDSSQTTLASLIIGDVLKDDPAKRYVRIPGQDPVYVVKLDDSPLTTQFRDWIEDDLLKLSSIDIQEMEIKDYSAALNVEGNRQIALTRNYAATVEMDGSQWKLKELIEYDPQNPLADPTSVDVRTAGDLNTAKLDTMQNALDDLKIADVLRKPDGLSANLRADQDLLSDDNTVASLAQRGFYPAPTGPNGAMELLSANGELSVTLNDGVRYVMRFGNIAGVSDNPNESSSESSEGAETEVEAGVNRYLLVTTMVDMSKFPPPELRAVPQTLEDLEAIFDTGDEDDPPAKPDAAASPSPFDSLRKQLEESKQKTERDDNKTETDPQDADPQDATDADTETTDAEKPAAQQPGEGDSAEPSSGDEAGSTTAAEESAVEPGGQDAIDDSAPEPSDQPSEEVVEEVDPNDDQSPAIESQAGVSDYSVLTKEEKLELLEAEQEKITKANQRKLDERKDRLEDAQRRVRDLNERFADWYYVIPEDTYAMLRVSREELFGTSVETPQSPQTPVPQFSFPGLPTN